MNQLTSIFQSYKKFILIVCFSFRNFLGNQFVLNQFISGSNSLNNRRVKVGGEEGIHIDIHNISHLFKHKFRLILNISRLIYQVIVILKPNFSNKRPILATNV